MTVSLSSDRRDAETTDPVHVQSLPSMKCSSVVAAAILLLGLAVPVQAQPTDLSGFSFLRLEPSARAAALGGSFNAVYGDDVNAFFYNPALLNDAMHGVLSVSYLNHLSDINAGFAAYSRHLDGIGTVGGGLRFLSWGELQGADEQGNRTETFGASDVALTAGLSRAYGPNLRYGANVHVIYSSIDTYNASALASDLGVLYAVPSQQLTLSASVHNLGVTLNSLGTTTDELPVDVRVGATKQLRYLPLLVSVMGYNLHDYDSLSDTATTLDNILGHLAVGGSFSSARRSTCGSATTTAATRRSRPRVGSTWRASGSDSASRSRASASTMRTIRGRRTAACTS